MTNTNKPLPPIIESWIQELNNPKTPPHIQENYKNMLENVVEASNLALQTYYGKRYIINDKKK
jgi:hypothetical protein